MPAHYVYQEPDRKTLCQGDVLRKTEQLVAHLRQYHPYYSDHVDYKYFMVLTQSCDLERREGAPPDSPYISLAAVRPVEGVLHSEAAKSQTDWQRTVNVIGAKANNKLAMFLKSLFDNNKEGYFYLHMDVGVGGVGIQPSCCASCNCPSPSRPNTTTCASMRRPSSKSLFRRSSASSLVICTVASGNIRVERQLSQNQRGQGSGKLAQADIRHS